MKRTFRTIDDFGRIVIPKPIRERLYMCIGDQIDIKCSNEQVILSKIPMIKCACGRNNESIDNYCSRCGRMINREETNEHSEN